MASFADELAGMRNSLLHMRMIVFFTRGMSLDGWDRGGMFEREVALYKELCSYIGEIAFLTYGGVGELKYKERLGKITILPNRWSLGSNLYSVVAPLLHYRAMRKSRIFKTNQINGAWCAAIAKLLFRKKLVVRCGYLWSVHFARLSGSKWKRQLVKNVEEAVFRVADRIVVATEADRRHIVEHYRIGGANIRVIPNYVDTEVFRPRPEVEQRPGLLCFVGRLDEQKNPLALLEAIRDIPKVRLAIVGDGPLRPVLENRVREDRLPVEFLGTVSNDQLPALLNRSQLFVLPSLYEGHPKALLEAMACGMPVIGTEVSGIKDVIVHRETGYLCGTSSLEIRTAIMDLMGNVPLCRYMAAKAREYVEAECSLKRAVEHELALLVEV